MKIKRVYSMIFQFLLILIVLTSCESLSEIMKKSPTNSATGTQILQSTQSFHKGIDINGNFLLGIPCNAPCMINITPGITTKSEMYKQLKEFQINSLCNEKKLRDDLGYSLKCPTDLYFDHNGEYVTKITFYPSPKINLEQVINKYGNPDFVNLIVGGSNQTTIIKQVFFIESQIILHFPIYNVTDENININNNEITGKIIVEWVEYIEKEEIQKYQSNVCSIIWNGYGEYEINQVCK